MSSFFCRSLFLAAGIASVPMLCQAESQPAPGAKPVKDQDKPAVSKPATPPAKAAPATPALAASDIVLLPGFKAELLYTVPKTEQGSWVGMTVDAKGRIIATDQYGAIYQVTVPPAGSAEATRVEPIAANIGGAHGVLYAFNSLYVMVGENIGDGKPAQGLWRLRDTDGDNHFAEPELLAKFTARGEHGPHSLTLGPDKKSIYIAAGNHTPVPTSLGSSRAVAYGEDHLLTRMWDANGHAKGILAPGGVNYRIDPDGKVLELFTMGFRNQFDLAFDANGELFTYDSDMEWDIGTPWYLPTRICHSVYGGDFGWRSGSGRWPSYYADSLPGVVDIGPGSPTGVTFGTGAKFPAKYQHAFYGCDWTYGTMYAIHLQAEGASFTAKKEEFLSGKPLPLTDVIIHPKDGAMYFTIGGRKTQSALYRVTYTGSESTKPAAIPAPTAEAKLRHELEALQPGSPGAVEKAWTYLAHKDRFLRFAARVALEHQPVEKWAPLAIGWQYIPPSSKAFPPTPGVWLFEAFIGKLEAWIALARVGDKSLQPQLIEGLERFDFVSSPKELQLPLLRAWDLTFTRMGKPAADVCARLAAKLEPAFPTADPLVNRELLELLVFLDAPNIVAKTVSLLSTTADKHEDIADAALLARNAQYAGAVGSMQKSRPNQQQIAYAKALHNATVGWTPELRKAYFAWFPRTSGWKGGNSFSKFLENIRTEALTTCVSDPAERATLDALSKKAPVSTLANLVMPKGPGKNYSADEVVALAAGGLHKRDFARGKAMFSSALCSACHHFGGEGGNVGPDITGAGSRYSLRDLLENIIEPSKVISDQYGSEQIVKKDGSLVIGRVVVEENGKLFVMTSPLAPDDLLALNSSEIKSRSAYPVSMMPPGLINSMNADELLDLLAYIQSAGKADDKAFR